MKWSETIRAGVLAAMGGVVLCAGPPAEAKEQQTKQRPLQARVDEAIDEGVVWMRSIQREDGTFVLSADTRFQGVRDTSAQWAGGPWDKGLHAMCLYALAVCDVPADDPALEKGFSVLRRMWDERPTEGGFGASAEGISTYFVSLSLLALDAHYNRGVGELGAGPPNPKRTGAKLMGKRDFRFANELLDRLAETQDPGNTKKAKKRSRGKKGPRSKIRLPKSSAPPSVADGGSFGYEPREESMGTRDNSNTQFALLGMKAAARLGVEVPEAMWNRALRHWIASQEKDGPAVARVDALSAGRTSDREQTSDRARGWKYSARVPDTDTKNSAALSRFQEPRATMTSGGVSSLVICRSELADAKSYTAKLAELTETAIRDGLAWLAKDLAEQIEKGSDLPPGARVVGGTGNFFSSSSPLEDFYYLYGLERACMLAGVANLGETSWWTTGAERILARQREDGAFLGRSQSNGNGRAEIDSCFALLFLRRAVFRTVDKTTVTPSTSDEKNPK